MLRAVYRISPPVGAEILEADKKASTSEEESRRPEAQYYYTAAEKQRFREDPQHLLEYRKNLECKGHMMFELFIKNSEASKYVTKMMKEEMLRRIGPGHEDLKESLIPSWPAGCKLSLSCLHKTIF